MQLKEVWSVLYLTTYPGSKQGQAAEFRSCIWSGNWDLSKMQPLNWEAVFVVSTFLMFRRLFWDVSHLQSLPGWFPVYYIGPKETPSWEQVEHCSVPCRPLLSPHTRTNSNITAETVSAKSEQGWEQCRFAHFPLPLLSSPKLNNRKCWEWNQLKERPITESHIGVGMAINHGNNIIIHSKATCYQYSGANNTLYIAIGLFPIWVLSFQSIQISPILHCSGNQRKCKVEGKAWVEIDTNEIFN